MTEGVFVSNTMTEGVFVSNTMTEGVFVSNTVTERRVCIERDDRTACWYRTQ
jgi:hypothetical protein